ncbi:hypothetical protein [Leptolyngbya ohadii]|uniref:hypothetical protein n=1 Tax=Leptolyngbya ohadii TaxID=1962290 RepID=UPI00117AA633|nr:hypothetical protein [Leptolyngbya ohadii]
MSPRFWGEWEVSGRGVSQGTTASGEGEGSIEPSPSPEAVVPIESPAPEASPSPEASPNAPTGVLPEFVRDLLNSGRNSEGGDRDTNKPRRLESNELRREQEYRNEMARAEEANRADALRGVAGIPVGTRERSVLEALGEPTERNPDGYWNNTRTAIYNVVDCGARIVPVAVRITFRWFAQSLQHRSLPCAYWNSRHSSQRISPIRFLRPCHLVTIFLFSPQLVGLQSAGLGWWRG